MRRVIRELLLVVLLFAPSLACAQDERSGPAAADLLRDGEAALQKGQFGLAADKFGKALRAEDMSEELVAKALYQRGVAYERSGKPAQAIADITGALYLRDLQAADRAKAYLSRGRAYEAVGMNDLAQSDIQKAKSGGADETQIARAVEPALSSSSAGRSPAFTTSSESSGPSFATGSQSARARSPAPSFDTSSQAAPPPVPSFETRIDGTPAQPASRVAALEPQARSTTGNTEDMPRFRTTIVPSKNETGAAARPDQSQPQEKSGRVGRFIGNLWSSATGKKKETKGPETPSTATAPARQWDQTTTAAKSPPPSWDARVTSPSQASPPAATPVERVEQPATPPPGGSGYRIQLAALKSNEEAQATWKRLKSRHGALLNGHQPNIVRTELGGLGTFYRLQLGPFVDKDASKQLCNSFKAGGLDCFLLAP